MKANQQQLSMSSQAVFRIRVQGILSENWPSYIEAQAVSVEQDATAPPVTTLISEPVDQSALVGLISYLNTLQVPLISVEFVPDDTQS